MSQTNTSNADKQHPATPQRLQRAREQGDVPYSSETTAFATYLALFAVVSFGGGAMATRLGEVLSGLLRNPQSTVGSLIGARTNQGLVSLIGAIALPTAPLFVALIAAAVLSIIAQRAFVIAPNKLAFKFNRLNPISNAGQKYGVQGLFEFLKGLGKLAAIFLIVGYAMRDRILELPGLFAAPTTAFGEIISRNATYFLGLLCAAAAVIAAVDFPFRQFQYRQRLRMTTEELKRESKENEGDPVFKQKRRERGAEIAKNRMLADVPKANVVIVNPTHYAVALQWDRKKGGAPICVAKGVDEIAARIREIAAEAGVPIRRDPPTARSIFGLVDIGKEIQREHYAAVAAAIHFADEIRRKAKARP